MKSRKRKIVVGAFLLGSLFLGTTAFAKVQRPLVYADVTSPGVVVTPVGGQADNLYSVTVQPDGKILAVGATFNGRDNDIVVLRYLASGALDLDFGTNGISVIDSGLGEDKAYSVTLQPNGKIVLAGTMSNGKDLDFAIIRLDTNGRPDRDFGKNGIVTIDFGKGDDIAYSVQVQKDGKLVASGAASNGHDLDFALVRLDSTGNADLSFGHWGRVTTELGGPKNKNADERGYGVAVQSDGKLVVAGFSQVGESSAIVTLRYLPNGSLDPYFGAQGKVISAVGPYKDFAYSVALQKDGKILVGGSSSDGTSTHFALLRLLPDGRPDRNFGRSGRMVAELGTTQDIIYSIALEENGNIVCGGSYYNGQEVDFALARFRRDGELDTSFGAAGKVRLHLTSQYDSIYSVALQEDGKIVAAGVLTDLNNYRITLVRLNSDGTLDADFGGKPIPSLQQMVGVQPRDPIRAEMGIPVPMTPSRLPAKAH